ncbi:MAG: DUF192 domain-containing protein [Hyphomicrobiales bacterium]|nr:DUF192 domain-containing protein [Hyphomicrobiales bacterium]MCP4998941.1 DUF192 domain-containing protein [Hyphomicrobiales bacterium]
MTYSIRRIPLSVPADLRTLAVLLMLVVSAGHAAASDANRLDIVTDTGTHSFTVELAITNQQRATGLMHREQMDENAGMLFRFDRVQPVLMWMKNTLIPLDMIFIRPDGTVADIHYNAIPHSEEIIQSNEPVLYVLEVNGGIAEKIGLRRDDSVKHPMIGGR